jgi:ankyrin repeat protein
LALLHVACQSGSITTVALLLERGANVNINFQNKVSVSEIVLIPTRMGILPSITLVKTDPLS